MAEISFSLGDLFEKTFGYKTKAFEPQFSSVPSVKPPNRKEQGAQGSPYYARNKTGMEYYMPVTITYGDSSQLPTTNAPFSPSADTLTILKKWNLPYPVISISSKKTIIETAMTERRGTVKELINIQDYEIIIKGFMIGENGEFPESQISQLRAIYEQNQPLSIQCALTDIFLLRPNRNGSDQVVITYLKFPSLSGVKHVMPYEIHMASDEPFNLISIS